MNTIAKELSIKLTLAILTLVPGTTLHADVIGRPPRIDIDNGSGGTGTCAKTPASCIVEELIHYQPFKDRVLNGFDFLTPIFVGTTCTIQGVPKEGLESGHFLLSAKYVCGRKGWEVERYEMQVNMERIAWEGPAVPDFDDDSPSPQNTAWHRYSASEAGSYENEKRTLVSGQSQENSHSLERASGFDDYTQSQHHVVQASRDLMVASGELVTTINIATDLVMTDPDTNVRVKEAHSSSLEVTGSDNDFLKILDEINTFQRNSGAVRKMEFSAELVDDLNNHPYYGRVVEYLGTHTNVQILNEWDGNRAELFLDYHLNDILGGSINKTAIVDAGYKEKSLINEIIRIARALELEEFNVDKVLPNIQFRLFGWGW